MKRTDQLLVCLIPLAMLAAVAIILILGPAPRSAHATRTPNDTTATASPRAVIYGCEQEDSCRANYHANGTWTIRIAPH